MNLPFSPIFDSYLVGMRLQTSKDSCLKAGQEWLVQLDDELDVLRVQLICVYNYSVEFAAHFRQDYEPATRHMMLQRMVFLEQLPAND